MKNLFKIFFTCFVFLILTTPVFASSARVSITGDQVFTDEITLYVQISNITDFKGSCNGVCTFIGIVEYDEEQLELVEVRGLNNFTRGQSDSQVLYFNSSTGIRSTTRIISLKFKNKDMRHAEVGIIRITNLNLNNGTDNLELSDISYSIVHQTAGMAEIENPDYVINPDSETTSKSSNCNLSDIKLSAGNISFSKDNVDYQTNVAYTTDSIDIEATSEDENATITGLGNKQLSVGDNIFDIVITAENGNTKTYTITVNRLSEDSDIVPDEPSTNEGGSTIRPSDSEEDKIDNIETKNPVIPIVIISLSIVIVISIAGIVLISKRNRKEFK